MMLATLSAAPQSFTVSSPLLTVQSQARIPGSIAAILAGYGNGPRHEPVFLVPGAWPRSKTNLIARAIERVQQDQRNLQQAMARDIQTIETTNVQHQAGQCPCSASLKALPARNRRRAREVEELVDRSARIRLSVDHARDQADLHRFRVDRLRSAPTAFGLLRGRNSRQARSTARDRSSRSRSATASCRRIPRPVTSRSSRWWLIHQSEPASTLPDRLRRRNDRGDRHPSVLEGQARAGRWPASSSPAIVCAWLAASIPVRSIEPGEKQPVYNLDVAENRNFFVGDQGLLVHDFSFVQPVAEPFDRAADLASQGRRENSDPAGMP